MKGVYLAHIILPDVFNQHFYELIPQQRKQINSLLEKGIVMSYSLDMERKNVWVFMEAENERGVMNVLSTFPIITFVKVSIHELAFYDAAHKALPDLILN